MTLIEMKTRRVEVDAIVVEFIAFSDTPRYTFFDAIQQMFTSLVSPYSHCYFFDVFYFLVRISDFGLLSGNKRFV